MTRVNIEYLHNIDYDDNDHPRGGFTLAYYVSQPDQVGLHVAVAFCRPDETFSRKIGRTLAEALLTLGLPSVHHFYIRTLDLFPEALQNAVLVKDIRQDALHKALLRLVSRHRRYFRQSKPLSRMDTAAGDRTRESIVDLCFPPRELAKETRALPRFLQGRIDLETPRLQPNLLSDDFEEKFLAPERSLKQG